MLQYSANYSAGVSRRVTLVKQEHGLRHGTRRQVVKQVRQRSFCQATVEQASTATTGVAEEATESRVSQAVAVLKTAAFQTRRPGAEVCAALVALEKAKLKADNFLDYLGGHQKLGGKTWKLVFTANAKQVAEAVKGGKGGGLYFPVTACQRWDAGTNEIENGIYLGQVAALAFRGPFSYSGRKLAFNFETIRLRLGPKWFDFRLKPGQFGAKAANDDKRGPFFLFAYADEDIVVARGREGGIGFWARTAPDWLMASGVAL